MGLGCLFVLFVVAGSPRPLTPLPVLVIMMNAAWLVNDFFTIIDIVQRTRLVGHSWTPVCVYRTGPRLYRAPSTKAILQHVWTQPWWAPPGWDRRRGLAVQNHCCFYFVQKSLNNRLNESVHLTSHACTDTWTCRYTTHAIAFLEHASISCIFVIMCAWGWMMSLASHRKHVCLYYISFFPGLSSRLLRETVSYNFNICC